MDEAKEFFSSILKTVRDRFSNPLISAFAIAWSVWNFRIILVLLGEGDGGWLAKINYLDKQLMVPTWTWIVHGLIIPLLFSILWIFIFPPILRKIAVFHERQSNKTKDAMIVAFDAAPISAAELSKLREKFHKERKAWNEEREELLKALSLIEAEEKIADVDLTSDQAKASTAKTDIETKSSNDDFSGMNLIDKIDHLNLHVDFRRKITEEDKSNGLITFAGQPILWPWILPTHSLNGISPQILSRIGGATLSKDDLYILYHSRGDDNFNIANSKDIDLRFKMKASLDNLEETGLISQGIRGYNLTSVGRIFLAWLLRIGFEFWDNSKDNN